MNPKSNHRLPKIALCLSLIPLSLYLLSTIYVTWKANGDGDWGWLLLALFLWWVCSFIHLGCASVGLGLSVYAVKKKIRMKTSVTAMILSSISIILAIIIVYFLAPFMYGIAI